MTHLVDHLLNAPGWAVYALVGLLVFAEDALFFGFVLPGETAAVLGGVMASQSNVQLAAILAIVIVAAIVGDTVGYEVGKHYGPRILRTRMLRRHEHRLGDAQTFLNRRGGSAVFAGRFVAFFRAVMPALAGTARMHYPKFLRYNAAGGIVWGTTFVLLGYFAGNSYKRIEAAVGRGAALFVAVLVIVVLVVWHIRRRRRERAMERDQDDSSAT